MQGRSRIRDFLNHYVVGLYNSVDEHHVLLLAGGLAFSLFTCLVPFLLIGVAILGSVLETHAVETQVAAFISALVPYENQAEFIKEVAISRTREFALYKGVYGAVGGFVLLFTASGLFNSMRTILNTVYRVERRNLDLLGRIRDFGMVFLVLCLFLVTILVFPLVEVAAESTLVGSFLERLNLGHRFYGMVSFLGTLMAFFAMYLLIPNGRQNLRVVGISAIAAVVLWEVARQAFGYYISHFATVERIYGAYVLIVLPALWIYYSSIVFIVGAQIGQLHRESGTRADSFDPVE